MNKMFKCCYGVSSKAGANEHTLFLDYDHIGLESVKTHLFYLQNEYSFSDIYIIKSTNGYNAICLDKIPLYLIFTLGNSVIAPVDRNFIKYGFQRGYYTLRFDNDKQLIEVLKSDNKKYDKSFAHKVFLEWFFRIKIDFDNTFDENTKLSIIQYPSTKNGYHIVPKELPNYMEMVR